MSYSKPYFFIENWVGCETEKNGCIVFKKKNEILIVRTLNELFLTQNFQRYLLRKAFDLKIKGINMITTKHKK